MADKHIGALDPATVVHDDTLFVAEQQGKAVKVTGRMLRTSLAGPQGPKGDKGDPGDTPYIGENGNWWIGDRDTGTAASGGGGNLEASFYLDIETGDLSMTTNDSYTGPQFRLENGNLEVIYG